MTLHSQSHLPNTLGYDRVKFSGLPEKWTSSLLVFTIDDNSYADFFFFLFQMVLWQNQANGSRKKAFTAAK